MKKFVYTFSLMLMTVVSAFAEYDGRWYTLDENHNSSSGGFSLVASFIIGLICVVSLIAIILKDKDRDGSEKGCLTTFFVILLIAGFFGMLSQCQ